MERAEQAEALLRHDQEHREPSTAPHHGAERPDARAYVREQYALWTATSS
ncbi:hypothetical protein QQY66_34345 [Streptomyces sp. DG2A-72]|nr:hypothetical protein [Streptomyces sp. DG2A-72]MDO0936542.1 hypothetical protein [Streptomyces sp. DG2A-72]